MAYDLAPSLKQFRDEVNARWPQRDKSSDGWIGDTSHAARPSDHNPGARDLVHAYDTDEDLDGAVDDSGADAWPIVAQIVENRDPRVKYLIYEGRIIAGRLGPSPWEWRPYTGVNAHRHHVHLSILSTPEAEQDTSPWLTDLSPPTPIGDPDMAFIMRAPGKTTRLVMGDSKASAISDTATIAAFAKAGQVRDVTARDYDSIMRGLAAPELVDDVDA